MSTTSTIVSCMVVLAVCLLSTFGDCRHLADEEIGSARQQQLPVDAAAELAAAGPSHRQAPIRRAAQTQSAMAFMDPSVYAIRQNADQRRSRLYIGKRTRQTATFEAPDAYDVDGLSDNIDPTSVAAAAGVDGLTREQWVDRLLSRDGQQTKETANKRQFGRGCANE